MQHRWAIAFTSLALTAAAAPNGIKMGPPPHRSTDLPPPRDGNVAIQEELDAARRAGTPEAYDLFISRHSDHQLAEVARRERAGLFGKR